jgi:hypothetical protein
MTSLFRQLKSVFPPFNFSTSQQIPYLGRWKKENESKTYRKADYANNDHCGVCSFSIEYTPSKTQSTTQIIEKVEQSDESYYSYSVVESIPDK